jgi:hypothetical protein
MRAFAVLLPLFLLAACSSSPPAPEHADSANDSEQKAAARTDQCLDNPELAKSWGDCNVKNTVFSASAQLEKCRKAYPEAKGTVSFELHVLPDGHVKSAKALGGHHGKHTTCVSRVFRKLQFAPPAKDAVITVPYQLEP